MTHNTNRQSLEKADQLIRAIEHVYPSNKVLIGKSFLRGIFFGLGTTIGATIILGIVGFVLSQLKTVPYIKQIIIQTNVDEVIRESLGGQDSN